MEEFASFGEKKNKENNIKKNNTGNRQKIKPFIFSDEDLKTMDEIAGHFEKMNAEKGNLTKGEVITFLYRKPQFPIWGEMDFRICEILVYFVQYLVAAQETMFKSTFRTFNDHILSFSDAVELLKNWLDHMIIPQLRILSDYSPECVFPVCYSLDADTMQGTVWLIEYLKMVGEEEESETVVNTQFEEGKDLKFKDAVLLFEDWFYDILIP